MSKKTLKNPQESFHQLFMKTTIERKFVKQAAKPTFCIAASKYSLGHTRLTGSETIPSGCPRDSLVFNQSCAH